jgi:hypothetical protein
VADTLARGSSFRGLLRELERRDGKELVERILDDLDPEVGKPLRYGQVISVGWYPIAWYAALYASIGRVLGGLPALAFDLSFAATRHDFSTLHRVAIALMSPELLIGQAPRFVGLYYKGGNTDVVGAATAAKGGAEVRFSGWHGFSAAVWQDLTGGSAAVLEACRAKNVRHRVIAGGGDGDSHMTTLFEWSK